VTDPHPGSEPDAQDNSPQGQLEVTAHRVDFILTKRGQAANVGGEEEAPF
jgi:hypothetical protein